MNEHLPIYYGAVVGRIQSRLLVLPVLLEAVDERNATQQALQHLARTFPGQEVTIVSIGLQVVRNRARLLEVLGQSGFQS
jgi:hypothetical protein